MQCFHIHIGGRVQGVGFRPLVARLAGEWQLSGSVSNGMDGVHIHLESCETRAKSFLDCILAHLPKHAIVTTASFELCREHQTLESTDLDKADESDSAHPSPHPSPTRFHIAESTAAAKADLLITPDIALCDPCRQELTDPNNRRHHYAFTTCLHCGPRYSIMTALPYDRPHTTMTQLPLCSTCGAEYTDLHDRRHFSQTNSCPDCAIPMHWYPAPGAESPLTNGKAAGPGSQPTPQNQEAVLAELVENIREGKIAAVKGIGGYLLICDATRADVVAELRRRKHRPYKPFAILFPSLEAAAEVVEIRPCEAEALQGPVAPIVLCTLRGASQSAHIYKKDQPIGDPRAGNSTSDHRMDDPRALNIADPPSSRLARMGVMLPYTPLLARISQEFGKPLIATSANLSGSPILFKDADALADLQGLADVFLTYDREILVPQDDSVWQFTQKGQRIILRRARGMAPDFYPQQLGHTEETILATGADLKGSFALHHGDKIYISAYLGTLQDYRAQQAWQRSMDHLLGLLNLKPTQILADQHPGYFSRLEAESICKASKLVCENHQHHEAHFAALLGEHDLLRLPQPVLGLVWDGTGYGTMRESFGGECFVFQDRAMERVAHLEPFPLLLGDKMALEPRLSLLSLLGKEIQAQAHLNTLFTPTEWTYYQQLIQQEPVMVTTSMGRLIDAVAVLLGCCAVNSYEGQAAMELEALAMSVSEPPEPYHIPVMHNRIIILPMLQQILLDLQNGHEPAWIALRFWHSLAELAADLGNLLGIADIALSGGVFQNALLVGLIQELMSPGKKLWLHASLSPNDENISFGQLVLAHLKTRPGSFVHHPETNEEKSHHANYIMGEVSSSAIRNPASANSTTCV